MTVVRDVELHELIQPSEPVAERGIFNPLLIGDYEVVKGLQTSDRVYHKVPVARNGADRICKQGDVHDLWHRHQRLQVLPLGYVVVVQVQKLQARHACKHIRRRKGFYLILGQVNFLKVFE